MSSKKQLIEKWQPLLDAEDMPEFKTPWGTVDHTRRTVTAQILENTELEIAKGNEWSPSSLTEANPINQTGNIQNYDPVLINLVRRAVPNLMAYDIAGVQEMTGPTGLIFALRSHYANSSNAAIEEAFFDEANTAWGATGTHSGKPGEIDPATDTEVAQETGILVQTPDMETNTAFTEMAMSIEKVTVNVGSVAMKAEYSMEMAQDLKAIHGLDAESELATILSQELIAENNRRFVRTIYKTAVVGCQNTAAPGTFNLDVDADGRWSVEKFKGLLTQVELEANRIAKETRRGRGNTIICSSDVATILNQAGKLDYSPAINNNLSTDDTGNTFIGILNGRYKVFMDPYAAGNFFVVGYKGSTKYDAGLFYCPYVPLQMVRAVGENSFQPKIGFKSRYGMVANPFAHGKEKSDGKIYTNKNVYYRKSRIKGI